MFKQMKLGVKLICSFGVVSLIVLLLGLVGFYGASQSVKTVHLLGQEQLPAVQNLLVIKGYAENIRGTMRTLAISGLSREAREKQYRNLTTAREEYGKAWKAYEALPQEPGGSLDLEAVGASLEIMPGGNRTHARAVAISWPSRWTGLAIEDKGGHYPNF